MAIISVLVGTVREGRHGIKVAKCIAQRLVEKGHQVNFIDPINYPSLKTFHNRYSFMKDPEEELVKVRDMLIKSDGFFAVSPEYNYSYSAAFKTIIDIYFDEWKFKPFAFASYSMGGFAGVRCVPEMRSLMANIGAVPTSAFNVPTVQNNVDEDGNLKQESLVKQLDDAIKTFEWYIAALANHRKLDASILPKF